MLPDDPHLTYGIRFTLYPPAAFLSTCRKSFTPLESPAACSGDEDEFLLKRTRGLMPRVSRPVRRAKLF
jgi:hypothetical protein